MANTNDATFTFTLTFTHVTFTVFIEEFPLRSEGAPKPFGLKGKYFVRALAGAISPPF
jgi:hypothetical protein